MPLANRPVPMSNSLRLQDRIETLIAQTLPPLRKTRHRNLARLLTGIYRAEHVHLSAMADELSGPAQQTSKTRRMRRFLNNEEVEPGRWFRPVAQMLLRKASESGRLRILVDRLELSGKRRLLVGALAYRRRALPLWWRVERQTGATGAELQASFLEELAELVPPDAEAVLIGDGEFHSVDLLERARQEGWAYCVRLHADTYVRTDGEQTGGKQVWRECRALDPAEGEGRYVQDVRIAKSRDFGPVNLVYHWAEGEEEPWRLVTNLSPGFSVVRLYQRRMWIEQLFGDWQEERFHLHQTRLYEPETLSRLILGLSLVYVWLVAVASYVAGARLAPARGPYRSSRSELSGDWASVDQKVSSEPRAASNAIVTLLLKTVR